LIGINDGRNLPPRESVSQAIYLLGQLCIGGWSCLGIPAVLG